MPIILTPLQLVLVNVAAWPIIHLGAAWLGTQIPDSVFRPGHRLFRERRWESGGRFYERWFGIRAWKDLLPDGAALFDKGFPKKRLQSRDPAYLERYIRETCRGEIVHEAVALASLLFFLWNPVWVGLIMVAYALAANGPCIFTQRYNRIRLTRLLDARIGRGHAVGADRPRSAAQG